MWGGLKMGEKMGMFGGGGGQDEVLTEMKRQTELLARLERQATEKAETPGRTEIQIQTSGEPAAIAREVEALSRDAGMSASLP